MTWRGVAWKGAWTHHLERRRGAVVWWMVFPRGPQQPRSSLVLFCVTVLPFFSKEVGFLILLLEQGCPETCAGQ